MASTGRITYYASCKSNQTNLIPKKAKTCFIEKCEKSHKAAAGISIRRSIAVFIRLFF